MTVTKPITRCLFPLFSSDTTLPSILRMLFKKAVLIYKHFCDLFSWFSSFLFLFFFYISSTKVQNPTRLWLWLHVTLYGSQQAFTFIFTSENVLHSACKMSDSKICIQARMLFKIEAVMKKHKIKIKTCILFAHFSCFHSS